MPDAKTMPKVEKSEAEWRAELTPMQYAVLREKATERPFSGEYEHEQRVGTYVCAGCGQTLFESDAKFNSGCGWPSFTQPALEGHIDEERDISHGMIRTEVLCSTLQRPSRPCVRGWPRPDRIALLHQFSRAEAAAEIGRDVIPGWSERTRPGMTAWITSSLRTGQKSGTGSFDGTNGRVVLFCCGRRGGFPCGGRPAGRVPCRSERYSSSS